MHRLHSLTLATALAVAFTAASTASAQTTPRPDPAPMPKSGQPGGSATSDDTQFVQKAAASGRMEVEHGKMAAAKASNAQVKAFGNTLVTDHTAANQELMSIAKRKNIAIAERVVTNQASPAGGSATSSTADTKTGSGQVPKSGTTGTTGASGGVATTGEARDRQAGYAQQGKAQMEPWISTTGAEFDRGFIEAQVKAHQEAIALFEKQANDGDDGDLKAFAQKQLPALRNHLKQAQDLQAKLKTN
jgi:putative membrane protein